VSVGKGFGEESIGREHQSGQETTGYEAQAKQSCCEQEGQLPVRSRPIPMKPVAAGVIAAALLAGVYVALVGVLQDFNHAIELIIGDWYFVIPIVMGFGVQVGLFVYIHTVLHPHRGTRSTTAVAGAGTGTSTVAMIACCAHHLTDVLPILGFSGAALFLNDYRGPFMALGIATNVAGIVMMIRLIRKSHSR